MCMELGTSIHSFSLFIALVYGFVLYLVYNLGKAIYNCYFHPLAGIPGPRLRAAFYFPSFWETWTGDVVYNWHSIHETYGDIVRVAPDFVSVIKPEAWRDIYGGANKSPIPKDPMVYFRETPHTPTDIISAEGAEHARMRRLLNHAFSDQALRGQEKIINSYITMLIQKLNIKATSKEPVDMTVWLNFATFDVLGDLMFDESFDSLSQEKYDFWVANIFKSVKLLATLRILRAYPVIGTPVLSLFKLFPTLQRARYNHEQHTIRKTDRRLNSKTDRKDFMSYILKHNDERGMTRVEIIKTSGLMIIAGSETSATLLSGAVFFLTKSPEWLEKLYQELRGAFKYEEDMNFASLSQLKILQAVLQETFRMYPPVPSVLSRLTTPDGAVVCGMRIPPNTRIGIPQYPAYRSSRNFENPNTYAPERFLGDPIYKNDNRTMLQPFSVGPRNCIGQALAWAEIRAILARLVWNFDMKLGKGLEDWDMQKVFLLWDKPSLMVTLTPRVPV